jgi:protein-tyrosine-phosphatase
MAEGLLRKLLAEREPPGDFVVESAGTAALEGAPATGSSTELCSDRGIDITDHVARLITRRMIERADLILTMEELHRQRVLSLVPAAASKSFVITRYAGGVGASNGVPDPIGQPRQEYEATFREIEASIHAAMPKILALFEDGNEPTNDHTV